MRFMIIVKATQDSEAGVMPPEKLMAEMPGVTHLRFRVTTKGDRHG